MYFLVFIGNMDDFARYDQQGPYYPIRSLLPREYCWLHPLAPSPERLSLGNLSGPGVQNPHPQDISRFKRDVFPNTSRLKAVFGF